MAVKTRYGREKLAPMIEKPLATILVIDPSSRTASGGAGKGRDREWVGGRKRCRRMVAEVLSAGP